jgi:hypothetical protein
LTTTDVVSVLVPLSTLRTLVEAGNGTSTVTPDTWAYLVAETVSEVAVRPEMVTFSVDVPSIIVAVPEAANPDVFATGIVVAPASVAAVEVVVAKRGTSTRIAAVLVESTERTVPVSDSLVLVTPACVTLTVEPVVIGNVAVPSTWMTEAVPGVKNPVTAPRAGATGAAGPEDPAAAGTPIPIKLAGVVEDVSGFLTNTLS